MNPFIPKLTRTSGATRTPAEVLRDVARDVIGLGAPVACAGCGLPGESVCASCNALLLGIPRLHRPSPSPAPWPRTHVVSEYSGVARAVITAWKERGRRDAAAPLAVALARAIEAAAGSDSDPISIVPIPPSAAARRRRGEDAWRRVAQMAAGILADSGRSATVEGVLAHVRQPRDQSALSARERRDNLSGALACRGIPAGVIVIVDDIVTTGATLAEASRALSVALEARVPGPQPSRAPQAAAIAATTRDRHGPAGRRSRPCRA